MIKPSCAVVGCGKELYEYGALLLSPPNGKLVNKDHICVSCYHKIMKRYMMS